MRNFSFSKSLGTSVLQTIPNLVHSASCTAYTLYYFRSERVDESCVSIRLIWAPTELFDSSSQAADKDICRARKIPTSVL